MRPARTRSAPSTTAPAVPARHITVRRPDIPYADATLPRYFVADDLVRSHIAAMLSAVFPEGEDFFVRSVRRYRDRIDDAELRRQVGGFIGQEARHGREHRAFNDHLAELGYPTRFVDAVTRRGLRLLERTAPPAVQLAVTAGLEHYTASLAEVILSDDHARDEFATDEVRTLFTWHAMEESEHKAVAYDVFQHVSGSNLVRVNTMRAVHAGFLLGMVAAVGLSLALDRRAWNPLRLVRSLRGLRGHPFFGREMVRRLRDYHRRDFHPDDHDTEELLATWRRRLDALGAAS